MSQKGAARYILESITYTDEVFREGLKHLLRQTRRVQLLKDDVYQGSQRDWKHHKKKKKMTARTAIYSFVCRLGYYLYVFYTCDYANHKIRIYTRLNF